MMQRIEDAKSRLPHGIQDLQHVRNTLISFCNSLDAVPYLATLGDEIVYGSNDQECSVQHSKDPSLEPFLDHFWP